MNIEILKEIGFTNGEIKAYLALLKLGSSTSGPITDESGIARSKIYNVLERLMKKGLVSYIVKQKTRYYQAAEPIKLKDYVNEKEKEFAKQKSELDGLIPQLMQQQLVSKKIKEAQIFKGFKGIQTAHEHTYLKLKKGEEYFYLGVPIYQEEKYHLYWERDHKRREKIGIKCRLMFNQETDKKILKNRNKFKGCDARYIPFPIKTPSWILGYKDTTVIGLQSNEGMAIEIINQEIADSFKEYFESFWKLSKPLKL